MNIAILDENQKDIEKEMKILKDYFQNVFLEYEINVYNKLEDFYREIEKNIKCDLIVLEVIWTSENGEREKRGFEFIKKISNELKKIPLVVFSSKEAEIVFEVFEYNPIKYVRKNSIEKDLIDAICIALKIIEKRDEISVISKNGEKINLNISEVLYFERENKLIKIRLEDKKIYIKNISIRELWSKLPNKKFIMIHSGGIVNYDFVQLFNKNMVILKNSEILYFSRRKKTEFYNKKLQI